MIEEIDTWLDHNRKRIQHVQSFQDAAIIVAREVFGFKHPTNDQLELIEEELHGSCEHCKLRVK